MNKVKVKGQCGKIVKRFVCQGEHDNETPKGVIKEQREWGNITREQGYCLKFRREQGDEMPLGSMEQAKTSKRSIQGE